MDSREELERRVAQLEKQVSALKGGGPLPLRGIRKRASWGLGDIPFYDIALGPDLERGEARGHAKGIIAIGDVATGVVAFGGVSRGLIAFGGVSVGYACGGAGVGEHVVSATHRDPEAQEFFRRHGLAEFCGWR